MGSMLQRRNSEPLLKIMKWPLELRYINPGCFLPSYELRRYLIFSFIPGFFFLLPVFLFAFTGQGQVDEFADIPRKSKNR